MQPTQTYFLGFLVALLVTLFPDKAIAGTSQSEAAMEQAKVLLDSGNAEAAYQQLLPWEKTLAGQLEFDVLLGSAAVDSGHYTQGMFALERALVIEPDHPLARSKLAKAHYYLGEMDASKSEFGYLLNQNPSAETAKAIEKYLAAIDKAMGLTTTLNAYMETGFGWDSNINSATNANTVALPVFGGLNFALADNAQKQSDSFANIAGGAGFRIPTSTQVAYIGNVQFAKKINQHYQEFETGAIDLNLGVQFKHDDDVYTLAAQDNRFYVDDQRFRHSYGAVAQWQKNIDTMNQASIYGQYSKLEYDDSPIRDASRYVLGVNYAHAFEASTNPIMYLSAYIAQENALKSNTRFLDQDIYGIRAGGQLVVAPSWLAYVSAGYESRDYQADDPVFLRKRKDDQYDLTLGVNFAPARYWSVKPQINLIKNDSNIDLNGFERATMSIQVRRDFNW